MPTSVSSYLGIVRQLMGMSADFDLESAGTSPVDEKSTELPLVLGGHSSSFTSYVQGSQTENLGRSGCLGDAITVRTKTGKMISQTSFGDYTVTSDAYWLTFPYKTEAAFIPVAEVNTTGQSRTATVTVTAGGVSSTMYVTQRSR